MREYRYETSNSPPATLIRVRPRSRPATRELRSSRRIRRRRVRRRSLNCARTGADAGGPLNLWSDDSTWLAARQRAANQELADEGEWGMRGSVSEGDSFAKPGREPCLVDLPRSYGEHRCHGVVGVGMLVVPRSLVEVDEQHEARPRSSLVAVGQRMVPRDPAGEHCSLVVQVGGRTRCPRSPPEERGVRSRRARHGWP